ncbi:MAG TPA: glycerophosphodiester phosphodiesterase family protein [Anaerolineae bacterium]|nr:glycerophosphodiester phosphodiesterase family protein [Anaerolineae bacterium]
MPPSLPITIPDKPKPYIMAHRGNSAVAPENTLAAFRQAIADGADMIETDLHVTRDGVFVCIHDATLDRTTDGRGAVAELTLNEIKRFSASYGRQSFSAERVPTLEELIALLPLGIVLALELKTDRFLDAGIARRLADQLRAAGVIERTVVLSFHIDRVHALRSAAPQVPTGFITLSRLTPRVDAQLAGPFWPLLQINPLYVAWAHRRNMLVAPLDPRPDRRLWLYRLLGCDAVLSNDPAATLKRLGRTHSTP